MTAVALPGGLTRPKLLKPETLHKPIDSLTLVLDLNPQASSFERQRFAQFA
jgi:hypothetical protein